MKDSAIQGSERTCDAVPGKMFGIYLVKTSAICCVVYWFKGRLKGSNKWKQQRPTVTAKPQSGEAEERLGPIQTKLEALEERYRIGQEKFELEQRYLKFCRRR